MEITRVAIVEDEPPARRIAREFLGRHAGVEVVAEAGTCAEAANALAALRPEVVLLDVQMPDGDGFSLLNALPYRPTIVFTTAYEQFALRAFDAAAADYLVKPYAEARFHTAISRAIAASAGPSSAAEAGALSDRLLVHSGSRSVAVDLRDLVWAEALRDYSRLHLGDRVQVCGLGIGALEEQLDAAAFLRIHRSTIVAVAAIDFIESDGAGGYLVTLRTGDVVRASRTRSAALRERIV